MDLEEIRARCLALPGVTEDIKWDHHLCFSVAGKMFLITSPNDFPVSASFKVPEEDFERLCGSDGFSPASHLARYHWVHVSDISKSSASAWARFLADAYRLVAERLPKRTRAALGL